MKKTFDYIVVGSGTSGGVIAHNLAVAGAKCLLIEAGSQYDRDTFPDNEADASAQMYWGGGIEFSKDARMAFLRGRVVGGGSIINQALMDRFDAVAFKDWKDESGIDFFNMNSMKPYYEKAEDMIALHTFVTEERNRNAELFVNGCDKLGYKWHFLRRAQSNCSAEKDNDCIACLAGCHRDSKQSTWVAYIRSALKEGLKMVTNTEVQQIESGEELSTVHAVHKGESVSYKAKNVVLCGGAFGTTHLLYKSGFKKSYPALGEKFASHPQFMFFGIYDEVINAHKNMFQSVASKDPSFRSRGFKLENVFAGPPSIAMLYTGFGLDHLDYMKSYNRMTCAEVALRDENVGKILVDKKGKLVVDKTLTDLDRQRMQDGTGILNQILAASGAKRVIESPLHFGLHLMGGCRIGTDPSDSVVDPEFRIWGNKNIYVCDSSIFPNAPGINPALTIMALAHKLSRQLTNVKD